MRLEQLDPVNGGRGFDASSYIDPPTARKLWDRGYRFRFMYLRRDQFVYDKPDKSWPVSASRQEIEEHLAIGYRVGFYQFGRWHGRNYLTADNGRAHGYAAAWNAHKLTGLEGLTIYTDAEWTDNPPKSMIMPYLRAWGREVCETSQRAGCYRAYDGLSGRDWYGLPYYRSYAVAAGVYGCYERPPVPRGDCLIQHPQHTECGATIDKLFCAEDLRGDLPWVVAP